MNRTTIDFGIHLGPATCSIAVFEAGRTRVLKDSENNEATPCAVWFDGRGRKHVGQRAKDQHLIDPDNARIEFMRQMGKNEPLHFAGLGRSLLPEELCAELLMHLKGNVKQWLDEDITAAVITVPADFNAAQIEATKRAARLAGFEVSPFVQDPVAAATAYGFGNGTDGDNARWLVYDLGGGSFDAALVRRHDGVIRIESHGGDKLLGSKDIERAIVEQLLVPDLLKRHRLVDFHHGNKRWSHAMVKLELEAKAAKLRLNRVVSTTIDIDELCKEAPVPFEFELRRAHLEALTEPLIARTIRICRQVLAEKDLGPQDIDKLILVGGSTLTPYLRERLADQNNGIGIPLEFGVDPFTVVVRGAAIFAATQPLAPTAPRRTGQYQVLLDYKAIGPDTDPLVSGQVVGGTGESVAGFTIEFVNGGAVPPWRSGRLGLSPDGHFMTNLWAEPGRENRFDIELADAQGLRRQTAPASLPYTVGSGVGPQMLIHDIGIGLSDNTVYNLLKKGTPLPARAHVSMKTMVHAARGSATDAILMPVVEGGERRADRNEIVGWLRIRGTDLTGDLPAGSDVEVTLVADESNTYFTKAYIPLLDREVELGLSFTAGPALAEVSARFEMQKLRLARLREVKEKLESRLRRIDVERFVDATDAALRAAQTDTNAVDLCDSRLRDLQTALDELQDFLAESSKRDVESPTGGGRA